MNLSKNDTTFLRAMVHAATTDRPGRPKGAKDKQRRKNSRYFWDEAAITEKFYARFHKSGTWDRECCWIWHGASSHGFGYMVIGSRQDNGGKSPRIQAHRLSYELHLGDLAKGDLVAQKCGNKLCVNPRHLYTWRR